ncbi:MAG: ATP synthase F1 subunit delta [Balneolales bacterium]|nr:ATP synthase F1 subunit delta [Balneolales bacterium]
MIPVKAARRYSAALLGHAIENDVLETVLTDVELIHGTIQHSRELVLFLKNPIIKTDKKKAALESLFKQKVSASTWALIDVLIVKARFELLPGIAQAFIDSYRKHSGIIVVHVYFAEKPDAKQLDMVQSTLEKKTGKKVIIEQHLKPELLGGAVIKIDDTVIDGSVKHKLEQVEDLFFRAAV